MCGIISAIAQRDVVKILLNGLRHLEYRGYDSAGLAIIDNNGYLHRIRRVGKVNVLIKAIRGNLISGNIGIAHTRWATHGKPTENNTHPHISGQIVVVHNGIIENYEIIRDQLYNKGYVFSTQTDTEVIAHLIHCKQTQEGGSLFDIAKKVINVLHGSYSVVIMDSNNPSTLVAIQSGSPLVIGCGVGENFLASDQLALLQITNRFILLEEGDVAMVDCENIVIWNQKNKYVSRAENKFSAGYSNNNKGQYQHYIQKEIFEQPQAIRRTIDNRINHGKIYFTEIDNSTDMLLKQVEHIQIIACGTSYHSGMVSRYWFETLANIPCDVEFSSEFHYRNFVIRKNSLLIAISQSGETADTLLALRAVRSCGYLSSLCICNVPGSSLVRESNIVLMTKAGIEVGVASTKTFTTQLTVLLMLAIYIGRLQGISKETEKKATIALQNLPDRIKETLLLDTLIKEIAKKFLDKSYVLFLGRGSLYPIAMEGALKLKEISYIHAEAYTAGELKHGPLALIDSSIPVIAIAPNNELLRKLKSNIEEIRSRNGILYIFTEKNTGFTMRKNTEIIHLPYVEKIVSPIFYTIPMQLLAYHIALIKGTDVDHPRNLAKSVTVE